MTPFLAREHAEGNDLVFVEAAHQHAVHFERPQAGAAGSTNASKHVIVSVRHASDAGKALGIDRVHGNGHAAETCILEWLRQIGEQVTVGGEGNIEWIAAVVTVGRAESGEVSHELDHPVS